MTVYERAMQLWPLLSYAAINRQTLTYDVVASLIGVSKHGLGQCLEPVQAYCIQHDLPPLTVLVVSKTTGMPGPGFIAAEDIPEAHARAFDYDWLAHGAPSLEDFESLSKPEG